MQNAVVDALAHLGVRHIDLPCTPARVFAAITQPGADLWHEPPPAFATEAARKAAAARDGDEEAEEEMVEA